ncbi:hypothetical protein GCM10008932_17350 [Alkalibacterium iburiense]|uniref:Uncharacterized protein n=1 Tax=Alkalibacterium iburiense TaxID=290589 RepID=A0ABP3HEC3_9LACT
MEHNPHSFFNLYHGTIQGHINEILKTKQFIFKSRNDHWLGNGVYFFVDDINKAIWWSEMATRRFNKTQEDRGILFIEGYKIKREKLLDLDSEKDREKMTNFWKNNQKTVRMNLTSKDEEQRKIEARAKLINVLVDYHKMSAVKYTFHKDHVNKMSFLENLDLSNNEIQFCIVDTDSINFKKVRDITQEVI